MDIQFDCNKCGQHIVIDESGAGQSVNCPKCGQHLTVMKVVTPKATSGHTVQAIPSIPATKTCPYCTKEIRTEAIKCKHCGKFLNGVPEPQRPTPFIQPSQQKLKNPGSKGVMAPSLFRMAGRIAAAANRHRGLAVAVSLFLILTLIGLTIQSCDSHSTTDDQDKGYFDQKLSDSFLGITEQELIRRLGQPKEIRREPDGSLRSLVYEDSNTNVEMFIINGQDGLVLGGEYRGHVFHRDSKHN